MLESPCGTGAVCLATPPHIHADAQQKKQHAPINRMMGKDAVPHDAMPPSRLLLQVQRVVVSKAGSFKSIGGCVESACTGACFPLRLFENYLLFDCTAVVFPGGSIVTGGGIGPSQAGRSKGPSFQFLPRVEGLGLRPIREEVLGNLPSVQRPAT